MTLHCSPDGDSLGSCTAMKYVLERDLKCKVTLVSYDPLEENLAALPYAKEVHFGKDLSDLNLDTFDVVVCLDSANPGLLSSKQRGTFSFPSETRVIQLDHHATNVYYGFLNYVDAAMPSACSLLVEFFQAMGVTFDAELSRRLLLGICTDTGFFAYGNNPLIALRQSVFLIEHGVDFYNEISRPVRMSESLSMKRLFAALILNTKIDHSLRCAYSSISLVEAKKLGLNKAELRGGVRALQDLKDMDFVFTLTEQDGLIKGSFRSATNVDVSLFAKALNGGGHQTAAAFQLPLMPLDEAEKQVLATIKQVGVHRYKE